MKLIVLDTGACPGPDPGFAGMTFVVNFWFFTKPSSIADGVSGYAP
jgi:hypothetical protein